MIDFRADLHCHSTCSDGTLSPKELLILAKNSGLSGLSITDHDSIESYSQACTFANEIGIEIVTGAEFSTTLKGISVHILAYAYSPENILIKDLCENHKHRRRERNLKILEKLAKHNMPITEEEVLACSAQHDENFKTTIGRPHIALAMINKGYVKDIREAFDKYLGESCCCYDPGKSISTEDTLETLHKAGALVVIAHPHLIGNSEIVSKLLHMNFDGIEGYYSRFNKDQCERWLKIGKNKNWLITGGSDFHGDTKPNSILGSSWVNEETFRVIQTRFKENIQQ